MKQQYTKELSKVVGTASVYIYILVNLLSVECYPMSNIDPGIKPEKDEKVYPNGTVVGKYAYVDKNGNPVEVKYYADESNYGVELNSVKILHDKNEKVSTPVQDLYKISKSETLKASDLPYEPASEIVNSFKYSPTNKKYKTHDPLEFLERETPKTNHYKMNPKNDRDYEVYLRKELSAPTQCTNEKVQIYNLEKEKEKRRVRDLFNEDDANEFCEQF